MADFGALFSVPSSYLMSLFPTLEPSSRAIKKAKSVTHTKNRCAQRMSSISSTKKIWNIKPSAYKTFTLDCFFTLYSLAQYIEAKLDRIWTIRWLKHFSVSAVPVAFTLYTGPTETLLHRWIRWVWRVGVLLQWSHGQHWSAWIKRVSVFSFLDLMG